MEMHSDLVAELPFLRRYARALTGRQDSGDAYVAATLEILVEDPSCIDRDAPLRVELYRLFSKVWESIPPNMQDNAPVAWSRTVPMRLQALPPRAREAFLLMALEGFGEEEVHRILDVGGDDFDRLMGCAVDAMQAQIGTGVLIIEDQPIIAIDLQSIIVNLGHRVVNVARTATQAVEAAVNKSVGIVLADIQLADGSSGIEAANQILAYCRVPVIFVTAFPERLLTGRRPEPAFVITKPFSAEAVRAVVSQALFFNAVAAPAA